MAETLPTPPPEPVDTPAAPSREALLDHLDTLLERYLRLLDKYQTARQQLGTHLSSGYISLAQANFNAPRSARYGRDYFDERMQATRRVVVSTSEDQPTIKVTVTDSTKNVADIPTSTDEKGDTAAEHSNQSSESTTNPPPPAEQETPSSPTPKIKDPITMFGVLIPPALRSAQAAFVKAVEGSVPRLVELMRELRALEVEVGRARKALRKAEG